MSEARPSPEDFLRLLARQGRGRLKVYLGAAAGVGKTYAMLEEGNRLRERGIDVVAAYVEPHARPETAAKLGALEVVPPREAAHPANPALVLREMDLDAVLRRRPAVALVDEFAHSNAPGSRNEKRYQDVLELLDAGISVLTTVNVQHLESLCNVVEAATGVTVRERLPDSLLAEADQIATIDLPAEDLIDRLKAGNIYPPEQAARALEHFFTPQNLTRLRELAFSEAANVLDRAQRREPSGRTSPGPVARVLVAVSSRGPDPQALLRKAARLAAQLNAADWYAVYVRTPREDGGRTDAALERRLGDTLAIAQTMGGTVVVLRERDVARALAGFVREAGVTHVVTGRPGPRRWRTLFRRSLTDRLAHALPEADLILG